MAKIEIDPKYCKGCELCIEACPKHIIHSGTEITVYGTLIPVQTEPEKCIGCKLCGMMCPDAAITVYK